MPKTGVAPLAPVIAAAALIGFGWASTVEADYYPGDNTPGYYTVGSGGAKVQNQGSLDAADVVSAWNTWTSTSKLSTGTTGCGTSTSCFIMVDEGQTLNGTSCTVPYLSDSNPTQYGVAYQIIYGGNNIGDSDCNSLAQSSYAVFVLVLNYSLLHSNTTAKLHVQRHEGRARNGSPRRTDCQLLF